MTSIFETPWLLLICALITLVTILLLHTILPNKKKRTHLLIPLIIAITAIAADHFVKTDKEKINHQINQAVESVANENITSLIPLIDTNYRDSFHSNKSSLLKHAKRVLKQPIIENIHWSIISLQIKTENSSAVIMARIVFEPDFQAYSKFMLVKANISLKKHKNNDWLINQIEIIEINKQPIKWGSVKY